MQQYLQRKQWDPETIADVLGRLEEAGLIDDRQYAIAWIAERQSLHMRSRRQLEVELLRKGIAREVIADALSGIDQEGEKEALRNLARKKMRLPQYRQREKLTQYLVRQGYEYTLVKAVLGRLENENS